MPLCYWWFLGGDLLWWTKGYNPISGIVFPDWFTEPWFASLQCQWVQFLEQTCPTFCVIICVPFLVPPSCIWQKTEWATSSLINSCLATSSSALYATFSPGLGCFTLPAWIHHWHWTHSSFTEMHTMKDYVPSEVLFLKPVDFSVT